MAIEDILSKLSKTTRGRIQLASEIAIEKLPLASLSLTKDLNGGFARGRVNTVWGTKSSGKTSMLLESAGELQKKGYSTAFIDAEKTYEPQWSASLGVDNTQMILSQSSSIDAMTSDVVELIKAKVDFIIIDSVSGLIPSSYYEKESDGEMKEGLGGSKQIGTLSKELSNSLMKINSINTNSVIVFISQVRNKITTYGAMGQAQGGNALMFFSSTVVKLSASASDKEQKKGLKVFGDKLIEVPIGRSVNYSIQYSKTSPPGLNGCYDFYYSGDLIGVDQIGEIADLAVKNGIIKQGGAWFTYEEQKLQGRSAMIEWLKRDLTVREEIVERLNV